MGGGDTCRPFVENLVVSFEVGTPIAWDSVANFVCVLSHWSV